MRAAPFVAADVRGGLFDGGNIQHLTLNVRSGGLSFIWLNIERFPELGEKWFMRRVKCRD